MSLASSKHESNSNLGIVWVDSGATLDLADSQVALCWITGVTKQWKQFVENCIQEIRRLVPVNYWKHCHSGDNPWLFHLGEVV